MVGRSDIVRRVAAKIEMLRREAQAGSFWSYCRYHDPSFFARRPFLANVAGALQRAFDAYGRGEVYRLAMSLPPRSGKSYISTLFVTFCLGHYPEESVMRNCCDATLYVKLSRGTLRIMRSAKFNAVFPSVRLRDGFQNIDSWALELARTSSYFGAGVGGRILGEGASLMLMTDDLFSNWESAASEPNRERTQEWYLSDHDSRSERQAMRIDVGTRWSKRDVIGQMEEAGFYDEILRVPAMTDDGKSFCEDVVTTEELCRKRDLMDDIMWSAEWMQAPAEDAGLLLLPLSEMSTYDPLQVDFAAGDFRIATIDPADRGDDFAMSADIIRDGLMYVHDFICNNKGLEYNVPAAVAMIEAFKPHVLIIEGNGGWIQTAYDIREQVWRVSPQTQIIIRISTTNKAARMEGQAYYLRANVRFREDYQNDHDYSQAVNVITAYVRGARNKKDDALDTVCEAIIYARDNNLL